MAAERVVQARQVARTQRHGAAAGGAVGRVREADEPLSLSVLEQLHDRREAAVAGALGDLELVDESGVAPCCCNLGVAAFAGALAGMRRT